MLKAARTILVFFLRVAFFFTQILEVPGYVVKRMQKMNLVLSHFEEETEQSFCITMPPFEKIRIHADSTPLLESVAEREREAIRLSGLTPIF